MNYGRKTNKTRLIAVVAALSVVLAFVLGLLVWLETGRTPGLSGDPSDGTQAAPVPSGEETEDTEDGSNETTQDAADTQPPAVPDDSNGVIQTPYITLYYPEGLADHLSVINTNAQPYTLEFHVVLEDRPGQHIFDISLGEGISGNLGSFEADAGTVGVSMTIYPFEPDDTWTQSEIDTVFAMQDVVNDLIGQLPLTQTPDTTDAPVIPDDNTDPDTLRYTHIETPYTTLLYPARWESCLQVERAEGDVYRVLFYGQPEGREKQLLFSILFGGDEGEQLGVVTSAEGITVPVNVLMEALSLDGWSDEDAAMLYAMQEAVNQLIEKLPLE